MSFLFMMPYIYPHCNSMTAHHLSQFTRRW